MKAQSKVNRKYGWKPQLKKITHCKYGVVCVNEVVPIAQLPSQVDLRPHDSPILDQSSLGSCTTFGIQGNVTFIQPGFTLSHLFLYFNERTMEGTVVQDSGAEISDGVESIMTTGVCPESDWPYDISQFTVQPPQNCYDDAKKDILSQYLQINGMQEMKSCLAQGYPFVFGITVYESFEGAKVASTGIVPMPASTEQCLGGHCVCAVGYNDTDGHFIVRNSWSTGWGDKGYFYLPYSYMENLASDFTTIRK